MALPLAVPLELMVAGLSARSADAPLAGGANVTRPPAAGSIGLLAVTVTTSGAKTPALWPLPEVTAMVNRLDLEGADINLAVHDAVESALVGGDAGRYCRRRWPGGREQGHGLGRTAVVAQRAKQGIEWRGAGALQIGANPAAAAVGRADQVVAMGRDTARDVRAIGGRVPGHDGVAQLRRGRVTGESQIPPPRPLAELPLTVQSISVAVAVPKVARPPPSPVVELPSTVQLVNLVVPEKHGGHAAAVSAIGVVVADGAIGQRIRAARVEQAPPAPKA